MKHEQGQSSRVVPFCPSRAKRKEGVTNFAIRWCNTYYRERAARRTRLCLIVAGIAVAIVLVALVIIALFYDACTRGFDRSPRAIVLAFVEAVGRGDGAVAKECWEHHAYYDLEAGCSEICLSRVLGAR